VISLDTLRPDFLGAYGSELGASPALDELASRGLVFEDASATSPWTQPSHASLLTGLYPHNHGGTGMASLRPGSFHVAQLLGERGFETRAIVNSIFVAKFGLMEAFDEHQWLRESAAQREPSAVSPHAIGWLSMRSEPERPFFLFLHYYDAHSDYTAREEYERDFLTPYEGDIDGTTQQLIVRDRDGIAVDSAGLAHLRQRYAANIRQLDDQLRELFEYLTESGLMDDTLLVIVSDHGEEFLEHGGLLHGETQYQELVRIPMILHGPGVPSGARSGVPASLIDVAPTALELLGIPAPAGIDGVALRPFWERPSHPPDRVIHFEADHLNGVEGSRRAIRSDRFKLHYDLATRESQLFDLRLDPGETRDLSAELPLIEASLRTSLLEFLEVEVEPTPVRELSEQEALHLKALGYGQ
jgi:arylsulfatase A-like enzyme